MDEMEKYAMQASPEAHLHYWRTRALAAEKVAVEACSQRDRYAVERDHYRKEKFNLEAQLLPRSDMRRDGI